MLTRAVFQDCCVGSSKVTTAEPSRKGTVVVILKCGEKTTWPRLLTKGSIQFRVYGLGGSESVMSEQMCGDGNV